MVISVRSILVGTWDLLGRLIFVVLESHLSWRSILPSSLKKDSNI